MPWRRYALIVTNVLLPSCTGEMINEADRCKKCNGKKTVEENKLHEVRIEPGSRWGERISLHGEGDQEVHSRWLQSFIIVPHILQPNAQPGDIIIELHPKEHEQFDRKGDDLYMEKVVRCFEALFSEFKQGQCLQINLNEAITGAQFTIQHLDHRTLVVESSTGDVLYPCKSNVTVVSFEVLTYCSL